MIPTIGVYIIARNNEKTIGNLLAEIRKYLTDIIVVVDTGSTDRTVPIAWDYAMTVLEYDYPGDWKHDFLDDFSRARNMGMDELNTDWVVWFDTDDIVDERNLTELRKAIEAEHENEEVDTIACYYVMFHHQKDMGRVIRMGKNKAWRKGRGRWVRRVHEIPKCEDLKTVLYTIEFPTHHIGEKSSVRNLTIYLDMIAKGEPVELDQWFDIAREFRQNDDYDNVFKYINKYIDGVNKLKTLIVDGTRTRQKFLSLAYHYRSTYWFLKKNYKNAREDAYMGIMVDDTVPHNFIQIGWIHANRGLYQHAIPWFMHAYNVPKLGTKYIDYEGVRTFDAVGALAICWMKLGNIDKALKFFNMAMENHPDQKWIDRHKELYDLWSSPRVSLENANRKR